MSNTITIEVNNLRVKISGNEILKGIDFKINTNESIGIVGESGSGKTMMVRSLMGLLPNAAKPSGNYKIDGQRFKLNASEKQWKRVRGSSIGMVIQDPFTALDPLKKCGAQILDGVPKAKRSSFDVSSALKEVGLPADVAGRYPFELSGGQRQRVVISAALATQPRLLIADEATTALDVITQKEILDLIDTIRSAHGMPLIIITHNIRLAKTRCDRILVMDNGRIVEQGASKNVTEAPEAEATKTLIEADRFLQASSYAEANSGGDVLLRAVDLNKRFGSIAALINVNVEVCRSECVGIVGQSGSGKTTLARCLTGLTKADSGEVKFFGKNSIQIVFQDPYSSLNPAHTIQFILEEALKASGRPLDELEEIISLAEVPRELLSRRPASLSGGQRQRVAIARALAPRPDLLICDESVSALDVVVQNQILKTLDKLRHERKLAILFITHDLSVLRMIAGRVYVMNHGRVVESGTAQRIFEAATDEYTKALIEASAFGSKPHVLGELSPSI
ncbi:MAG: ABC transporter ATP-binding protein [Oscillospiraceae bacterium]|jgi:peptide/nickel transport system ATP-binding protein|nr:ABC transporter ATP-binding protein [Oscillospiraceae bacterium]